MKIFIILFVSAKNKFTIWNFDQRFLIKPHITLSYCNSEKTIINPNTFLKLCL